VKKSIRKGRGQAQGGGNVEANVVIDATLPQVAPGT
jgi:hypothetical protein